MSEKQTGSTDESTTKPKKHRLARATVGLLALGTVGAGVAQNYSQVSGLAKTVRSQQNTLNKDKAAINKATEQAQRLSTIVANLNNLSPNAVSGSNLHDISKLPGHEKQVSLELRDRLEASMVKLGRREKGSNSSWYEWCTAVKVSDGAEELILTANHCFETDTRPVITGQEPESSNITQSTQYEYSVLNPKDSDGSYYSTDALTTISSIAVDNTGLADWALLLPAQSPQTSEFNKIPSIPIKDFLGSTAPTPGEQVALYGTPQGVSQQVINMPIVGTGVYLGSTSSYSTPRPDSLSQKTYYVGIQASTPNADACNYGASGSVAMFADGQVSGPLSMRNNIGYGPAGTIYSPDTKAAGEVIRLQLESDLGLNLDNVTTICGFSEPQTNTFSNLKQALLEPNDLPYATVGGK